MNHHSTTAFYNDPHGKIMHHAHEGNLVGLTVMSRTHSYLIDRPDDADQGRTALMKACASGHVEAVRFLLSRDCDPNKCDADGRSSLHYAAAHIAAPHGRVLANLLFNSGADPEAVDKEGLTPAALALKSNPRAQEGASWLEDRSDFVAKALAAQAEEAKASIAKRKLVF